MPAHPEGETSFPYGAGGRAGANTTSFLLAAEKIGTNRRLLDRKLIFDFVRPFDFVLKYTEKCESRRCGINSAPAEGGASEPTNCPQNSQCLTWSQLLNEARTFFERNSDWLSRFARQKLNARAGKNSFPPTPFLFARLLETPSGFFGRRDLKRYSITSWFFLDIS